MAMDIETTISDIKLFLQKLQEDLPEIFTRKGADENGAQQSGKVLYLGKLLDAQIELNPDAQNKVILQDGSIFISINCADADINEIIELWLRKEAAHILPQRTKEWAGKLGVEYNHIVIKDQKTMWASCSSKKNINYSYRIVKMPSIIIDYLIIHELTHLIHFNHGADYWATVAQFSPDYKAHRKWLNDNKYAVMADVNLSYNPAAPKPQQEAAQTQQEEQNKEQGGGPQNV